MLPKQRPLAMKTLSFLVPHDSPFLSNTQRAQLESLQSPAGVYAAPYRPNATLKLWRKAHVGEGLEASQGPRPSLAGHKVWWVAKFLGICLLLVAAIVAQK